MAYALAYSSERGEQGEEVEQEMRAFYYVARAISSCSCLSDLETKALV